MHTELLLPQKERKGVGGGGGERERERERELETTAVCVFKKLHFHNEKHSRKEIVLHTTYLVLINMLN